MCEEVRYTALDRVVLRRQLEEIEAMVLRRAVQVNGKQVTVNLTQALRGEALGQCFDMLHEVIVRLSKSQVTYT